LSKFLGFLKNTTAPEFIIHMVIRSFVFVVEFAAAVFRIWFLL
jgi:hypothetical protein